MKHVMVDIETAGTKPGCAVLQIGAIIFDPFAPKLKFDAFECRIDLFQQLCDGMTIDAETIIWWSGPANRAARMSIFGGGLPTDMLHMFVHWIEKHELNKSNVTFWSKGNFDFPILEKLFEKYEFSIPWEFRQIRELRTVMKTMTDLGYTFALRDPDDEHTAIADCEYQIGCVQGIYEHVKLVGFERSETGKDKDSGKAS